MTDITALARKAVEARKEFDKTRFPDDEQACRKWMKALRAFQDDIDPKDWIDMTERLEKAEADAAMWKELHDVAALGASVLTNHALKPKGHSHE